MNERDKFEQAELNRYGIQRVPADAFRGRLSLVKRSLRHRGGKEERQVTSARRRPEDTAEVAARWQKTTKSGPRQ